MEKFFSNITKIKIMEDLMSEYYHHQKDAEFTKLGEAYNAIKKREPYYVKVLDFLFLNHWTIRKASTYLYCSERTVIRKRNELLLELYDAVFSEEVA